MIASHLAACNAFVETNSLGNGVCQPGYKACNNQCVATDRPEVGCAQVGCTPCDLANAAAICSRGGACTISTCDKGFTDCDGQAANGCETETGYDPLNCGQCQRICTPDPIKHVATAACSAGACVVGTCMSGWGNCDEITADGCEADLSTDNANCGRCHATCMAGSMCNGDGQNPMCI
jgi:hypothetical protein